MILTRTAQNVREPWEAPDACMSSGGAAEAVRTALKVIQGRWKVELLFWLFRDEILRYSDFGRLIPNLSERVLTKQLKALENDGVILRTAYPTVPPQVDYRLTGRGQALLTVLVEMRDWGTRKDIPNALRG